MGKLVVSLDGVVIKEVQVTKDRTTLGRRPYNDIVIDNLAVSGEHAVLQLLSGSVFIEDLNSTNGTYINGKAVKKQLLQHNDTAAATPTGPSTTPGAFGAAMAQGPSGFGSLPSQSPASIKVLNGAAAGREVALTKVVTTVGKPGVQVASITKRPGGYVFAHVEGSARPTVNGSPVAADPVHLKSGDVIELAGTQMQFVQA